MNDYWIYYGGVSIQSTNHIDHIYNIIHLRKKGLYKMFKYLYLSLYILNLQLFKSINSAIICTGSSTFFCQNIAYYCIGQHCLLSSQMTVVNMPQFRKGERLKLIAHGTVSGWTPDEIKTISTAANPLSTGCWANQQLNDMWKMDHVLDHPVWLTNRMMHLLWDKHIIHNSSCPPNLGAAHCPRTTSQCLYSNIP